MISQRETSCAHLRLFGKHLRFVSYIPKSKSLYEILGIENDADAEQIKKAFVSKSRKLHPDGCEYRRKSSKVDPRSTTEQFMELKKAYDTLRKPEKRKLYDRELMWGKTGTGSQDLPKEVSRGTVVLKGMPFRASRLSEDYSYVFQSRDHFVNPTEELERASKENSLIISFVALIGVLILLNVAYVEFITMKKGIAEDTQSVQKDQ
ncbi:hypothetical protein AB6A40_007154 [Gnathostoma spinigerum]|uniref:J domain-containing protein n=1 Tax=Gnathostoma spinigerum TaxID=75299 RepID=A0ABD6EW14_9BILA